MQEAPWRPCHEAASIFGVCASKRRLWLRKPPLSSPSPLPLLNPATTIKEAVGEAAAEEYTLESYEREEHTTALETASMVEAAAHWKCDPWRTLLIKRHLPASVLRELASSGDLRGLEGCSKNDEVEGSDKSVPAGNNNSNDSDNGMLLHVGGSLVPGGVVVSFFDDDENDDSNEYASSPTSSSLSLMKIHQHDRVDRPWLVGLLETGGRLLLLAEGDVLRRHLLD